MAAQALSGIAKDLNNLSAKSSVKLLAGDCEDSFAGLRSLEQEELKGAGFLSPSVARSFLKLVFKPQSRPWH